MKWEMDRDPDRMWIEFGKCYVEPMDGKYVAVEPGLVVERDPAILFQTQLLELGESNGNGDLVNAPANSWFHLVDQVLTNPDFFFGFSKFSRQFERFIAGAYRLDGCDQVTLTPPSADKGRDVIAVRHDSCPIKVIDDAKAYSKGNLVTHTQVRAMLGVLSSEHDASKGVITTTSDFQPRIHLDESFESFIPSRLQLRNGTDLLKWLKTLRTSPFA